MKIAQRLLPLLVLLTLGACAHHGGHGHHKKGMMNKWNAMDKDGDGKVTKKEFVTMKTAKFESMDSNKDGILTADEAMAAKKCKKKKCDKCK